MYLIITIIIFTCDENGNNDNEAGATAVPECRMIHGSMH
jgi:hypothetical protein